MLMIVPEIIYTALWINAARLVRDIAAQLAEHYSTLHGYIKYTCVILLTAYCNTLLLQVDLIRNGT